MRIKKTYLILCILFSCFSLNQLVAQDVVFSQFYQSGPYLNPAFSSFFQGKFKMTIMYRDQWYSLIDDYSYESEYLSVDYKFGSDRYNRFSVGATLLNDKAGNSKYRSLQGNITGSFVKQLTGVDYGNMVHYLSIGAQGGFGQNSIQWADLWFGRQWDFPTQSIDRDAATGELMTDPFNQSSELYPNVNVGIGWYAMKARDYSLQAGVSLAHINRPLISTIGTQNDELFTRVSFTAGGKTYVSNTLSFLPAMVIHFQGPSIISLIGTSVSYSLLNLGESGFRVGSWVRMAKSIEGFKIEGMTISAMFERQNLQLGISYDFALTDLRLAANALGGFEVSLSYINPFGADYDQPTVPGI